MTRAPAVPARSDHDPTGPGSARSAGTELVVVDELRSDGDASTCLRPLGLCELGGSCDACWYRPDHPRFRK